MIPAQVENIVIPQIFEVIDPPIYSAFPKLRPPGLYHLVARRLKYL